MKIRTISISALIAAVVGAVGYYTGYHIGEINGSIGRSAIDTMPLMNLLLSETGKKEDLLKMDREQLYSNVTLYDALQRSWWVTAHNKRWLKENILRARDYWVATNGSLLQTDEEAKKTRQQIEGFRAETGITPTLTLDGRKVSPFYFEEEDQRIKELFRRYAGQKSSLHDMIVDMVAKAKNQANQSVETTRGIQP